MRTILIAGLVLLATSSAHAQLLNVISLDRVNHRLQGHVDDYTHNHGADRRVDAPSLGQRRDLYVYTPPGYDPSRYAYPVVFYLHLGFVDEHSFLGPYWLDTVDRWMAHGKIPPAIIVAPDGTVGGENLRSARHSLFLDNCNGAFQSYLTNDVLGFVSSRYSLRQERGARALVGVSAGGLGAMNLAIKRRDLFGSVATVAAPLNLRYGSTRHFRPYFAPFKPETYQPATSYDPEEVVGRFYLGLSKTRAEKYMDPAFGCQPDPFTAIMMENPADMLTAYNLQPGELNIFVSYPAHDNYNFDAQAESFAWLAAQRGICVTTDRVPMSSHTLPYFIFNHAPAFRWLDGRLLPPIALAVPR